MAATTKTSFIISSLSCLLLFITMQFWKSSLASSNQSTLLGGLLGSFLFTLTLTAIGNFETLYFGKSYQLSLFPEVSFALLMAVSAAASVHRVAGTSCLLFSLLGLFYINEYSQKVHFEGSPQPVLAAKKKKTN